MGKDYKKITVDFYLDENEVELLEELVKEFKESDFNNVCPDYSIEDKIRNIFNFELMRIRLEREEWGKI